MDQRTAGSSPAGAAQLNRLAGETSPYLRAHAHNPVDWYPWGPEALERARREARPILLSVGYAACHWCHVMAHESFEDPATAALMNELYVNIKVDREERPDLDRLYQLAQQMLTGRGGGWPLTMFLTHEDQRPFFGGTYFPPEARFGLPAFREVLRRVAAYYHEHAAALRGSAARVVQALGDLNPESAESGPLNGTPLALCRAHLERAFDREHGGFGGAPKFPHVPDLARLLRTWRASAHAQPPDLQALYMATLSLTRMAEGGLCDQLGGGFFRYSVDERWEIPHFEKMLYDNAQLLGLYAEAAAATAEPLFREAAAHTAAFMLRELASADGALYSSLDADSEGHEGRFYVWDAAAVRAVLPPGQWPPFAARYGLDGAPNFEHRHWHLAVRASPESIAATQQRPLEQVRAALAAAAQQLFELRATRVRPGLDDKILTSWNALAIGALATAARCLRRDDLAAAAAAALRYLRRVHWQEGRLLAVSAVGASARLPAYLDDHAFLIDAILQLARVRFDAAQLRWSIELAEVLLTHFEDRERGGFYFTADDHEALISRPKSFGDESLPAGNAVAARALLQLGYLLGETRYLAAAERALRAAWGALQRYPEGHASMLQALEDYLDPPRIIVLRGPAAALDAWREALEAGFNPRRWTLAVPTGLADLPAALADKPPGGSAGEAVVAYICRGLTCGAAIGSLAQLQQQLHALDTGVD
ncbi:MAG TPA: thioredoxin domain-containing protein [Steroidobacteraceae bacterium]|nr:thioredoxin domain-containing protein [Steroidobacteraceae bacterium]